MRYAQNAGEQYMIYRLMKVSLTKIGNNRRTKCSWSNPAYYGCKSIKKLQSGTPLGLNNKATISLLGCEEQYFKY